MPPNSLSDESARYADSLLLVLRNMTLMGLSLPPQLAQASWLEVERIFDLPEAKTLPYRVLDTYIALMTQPSQTSHEHLYHERLQALDEALRTLSAKPRETPSKTSYPVFGV